MGVFVLVIVSPLDFLLMPGSRRSIRSNHQNGLPSTRPDRERRGAGGGRQLHDLPHQARRQVLRRRPSDADTFGTIYSTNITPDPETGIGRWSEAAFTPRHARRRRPRGRCISIRHFPIDHFTKCLG